MSTIVILKQMAMILLLAGIGFFFFKKGRVSAQTSQEISGIVTDICNPALMISCVLDNDITATHQEILMGLLVAFVLYVALCLIGILLPRLLGIESDHRRFYTMMTVYTNCGFIGIPLAKAVLSANAMLYVVIFNMMYSLFFFTHGVLTLEKGKGAVSLKKMCSPGSIAAVLALVMFWFGIGLPSVLAETVLYIGNATTFLSMFLLGGSIAAVSVQELLHGKKMYLYVALRMIALPLFGVVVFRILHLPQEMSLAYVLMLAMPAANLPMIQAEKMGEDVSILSKGIVLTTLVSVVTIPLAMLVC